jgi:hypothetical protein
MYNSLHEPPGGAFKGELNGSVGLTESVTKACRPLILANNETLPKDYKVKKVYL